MPKISLKAIKDLREETGGGIMEVKQALEAVKGDLGKAKEWLKKQGLSKAAKRADKVVAAGKIFAYVHHSGEVGAMVALMCETDFVASSAEFQTVGKELAMQIAGMEPKNEKELMLQAYIRDPKKTVADLIGNLSAKCKEKIAMRAFERFSIK